MWHMVYGRAQGSRRRRTLLTYLHLPLLTALLPMLLIAFGACAPAPPQKPGGTYTSSSEFHFSVSYPAGWEASAMAATAGAASQSSAPTPLTVVISRSSSAQETSPLVSNLTIAILDLRNPKAINPALLNVVTTRATNSAYHTVQLAGHTAYATQPQQQMVYGTQQVGTHTDYYLDTTSFEYHLSTDVLSGDSADSAIASMLASFTLI
jgi:hypothetical protein